MFRVRLLRQLTANFTVSVRVKLISPISSWMRRIACSRCRTVRADQRGKIWRTCSAIDCAVAGRALRPVRGAPLLEPPELPRPHLEDRTGVGAVERLHAGHRGGLGILRPKATVVVALRAPKPARCAPRRRMGGVTLGSANEIR